MRIDPAGLAVHPWRPRRRTHRRGSRAGPIFGLIFGVLTACSSCSSSAIPSAITTRPDSAVLSPADGRVMVAGDPTGHDSAGRWRQISIFLSPMDVHVNRMPVSGRVTRREVSSGPVSAGLPGRCGRPQRIHRGDDRSWRADDRRPSDRRHPGAPHRVPRQEGDTGEGRDRFGVMKFGSRMDVFLPTGSTIHAAGR